MRLLSKNSLISTICALLVAVLAVPAIAADAASDGAPAPTVRELTAAETHAATVDVQSAPSPAEAGIAVTTARVAPFTCEEGDAALCLNGSRYQVAVSWRDHQGKTGEGETFPVTSDSGLFYFFSPNNIEMLMKVLDGCSINGHTWVFFAATTDVEFAITVTDSETGAQITYENRLGNPADAVTDTLAFPCA